MSAASVPLIDAFVAQHASLDAGARGPATLAGAREQALSALRTDGLPGPRSESWRYTPLRALARHAPVAPSTRSFSLNELGLAEASGPRIVLVNGRLHRDASNLSDLPQGVWLLPISAALAADEPRTLAPLARVWRDPADWYVRANTALAHEGVLLQVDDGIEVAGAIECVNLIWPDADSGETACHTRLLVEMGSGASATLHERWLGRGTGRHFVTHVSQIHLRSGARLRHLRVQDMVAGQNLFARSDIVLAGEAHCARLDLELGSGLSRHDLDIDLQGHGARVDADGVLLGHESGHLDTRIRLEHQVGETTCSMVWRGLARDRSKLAFHGGIHIREGADGSEAELSNKNLLLSDQAEVNTQPVLEIDADEVKAAHGATVGRLDPLALFYLRSRGLPIEQARMLLTEAFCMEPLRDWDEATRALLRQTLRGDASEAAAS